MAVPNFTNRMMLVFVFFAAIAMMACRPSVMPTESESSASPKQSEQSGPALLLDEASAISILQAYLQECVLGWDEVHVWRMARPFPQSEQARQSWLMGLAAGTAGDFAWSASYHGVTEVPKLYSRYGPSKSETWVVIGPGFDRPDSASVVPGRWKVYAGVEQVDYVDAPARLALEEYDSYDSCP